MRASHYLGNHRSLITTTDNLKLYVDTTDTSVAPHLILDGFWEEWVAEHIRRDWARSGTTIFEVGSNIGYYTTLLAHLVGPSGKVVGFEPIHQLAQLARTSLQINGFSGYARIITVAVGDHIDPEVEFTFCCHQQGSSSLYRIDELLAPEEPVTRLTIPMTTLDAYCTDNNVYPDFLKIDAEGAEPKILQGAEKIINTYRLNRILLEVNIPLLDVAKASAEAMLDTLRDQRFSLTEVHPDGLRPVTYAALRRAGVSEVYAERKG